MRTIAKNSGWNFLNIPNFRPARIWNPITGCANNFECKCPNGGVYCYMANQRKRFPDVHSAEFRFNRKEHESLLSVKNKSIIACGTSGDIFSFNSRDEKIRIKIVLLRALLNDQHFYFFLTKFPQNFEVNDYIKMQYYEEFKRSIALGVSVCYASDFWRIDELRKKQCALRYVMFEPCFLSPEDIDKLDLTGIDWVILGSVTGIKHNKYEVSFLVIEKMRELCLKNGIAYYEKDSLNIDGIIKEHPDKLIKWAKERK